MKRTNSLLIGLALATIPVVSFGQCAVSTVAIAGTGNTTVYTCPGDGIADLIQFTAMNIGTTNFGYLVTDPNGIILGIPSGDLQDFEGAPAGTCYVYGISYDGPFTGAVGDDINVVDLATQGCCILSSNHITVVRDMPDGGTVSTTDGENMIYTCPGDGIDDIISFMHMTASNSQYRYVVTDPDGNILGLPPANMVNFEGAGTGNCLVWGLSYTGNITAMIGDDAASVALSDGCFELSSNYITVVRDMPAGGTVSTTDGENMVYTCPGDGIDDIISFMHMTASNSQYRYVVTDPDGNILGLPPANMVNFEGAGTGNCLVWGLSYTGNITAMIGDDAASVALSDGCFELSSNYITVVRDMPDGGTVSTTDGENMVYTCPGDGIDDIISFMHMTASNSQYRYVVTDPDGNILGLPPANMVNFEGAGTGNCLVWGLSYTGNITAMIGDDAASVALSDGCFELSSNYITVVRDMPDGGTVSILGGDTAITTLPGDGLADVVEFEHITSSNSNYRYVVTDANGIILGLPPANMVDFEGAGEGMCLLWGLSYTGNLTAMMGDDVTAIDLSDGCFELSNNYVTVTRTNTDGGMITTDGGLNNITIDLNGGNTTVEFITTSQSQAQYAYVITDANDGIVGSTTLTSFDLAGYPLGSYVVYGLSYSMMLTADIGENILTAQLSTGSFMLSENTVMVELTNTLGVFDLTNANGDLELWPVPAGEVLNVRTSTNDAARSIAIVDLQGRTVQQVGVISGNLQTLSVSALPSGTYLVQVNTTTGLQVKRFIKQ